MPPWSRCSICEMFWKCGHRPQIGLTDVVVTRVRTSVDLLAPALEQRSRGACSSSGGEVMWPWTSMIMSPPGPRSFEATKVAATLTTSGCPADCRAQRNLAPRFVTSNRLCCANGAAGLARSSKVARVVRRRAQYHSLEQAAGFASIDHAAAQEQRGQRLDATPTPFVGEHLVGELLESGDVGLCLFEAARLGAGELDRFSIGLLGECAAWGSELARLGAPMAAAEAAP